MITTPLGPAGAQGYRLRGVGSRFHELAKLKIAAFGSLVSTSLSDPAAARNGGPAIAVLDATHTQGTVHAQGRAATGSR